MKTDTVKTTETPARTRRRPAARRKQLEALMLLRLRELQATGRTKSLPTHPPRPLAVVETAGKTRQRNAAILARWERTATDGEKGWAEIATIVRRLMAKRRTADRKTLTALFAYDLVRRGSADGGPEATPALERAYRVHARNAALIRRLVQAWAERELARREAGESA